MKEQACLHVVVGRRLVMFSSSVQVCKYANAQQHITPTTILSREFAGNNHLWDGSDKMKTAKER